MNILGIDWGKKRVGLAWVQSGLDVVLPFGIIETYKVDPLAEIIAIVKEERIDVVVFGLPKTLSGEEQANSLAVREVGEKVVKATGIKVEFLDERFSSRAADRFGADGASRDEKAAMIMVQAYLDQK